MVPRLLWRCCGDGLVRRPPTDAKFRNHCVPPWYVFCQLSEAVSPIIWHLSSPPLSILPSFSVRAWCQSDTLVPKQYLFRLRRDHCLFLSIVFNFLLPSAPSHFNRGLLTSQHPGITPLQPSPPSSAVRRARFQTHQSVMLGLALPALAVGSAAMWWNKHLHGAQHFTTWHSWFGAATVVWVVSFCAPPESRLIGLCVVCAVDGSSDHRIRYGLVRR